MICPKISRVIVEQPSNKAYLFEVECRTDCSLWCDGEKCCTDKLVALQLIKLEENR